MYKIILYAIIAVVLFPGNTICADDDGTDFIFNGGSGYFGTPAITDSLKTHVKKPVKRKTGITDFKHHIYAGYSPFLTPSPYAAQFGYDFQFGNFSAGITGVASYNIGGAFVKAGYYYLNLDDIFLLSSGISLGYIGVDQYDNSTRRTTRTGYVFGINIIEILIGYKYLFFETGVKMFFGDNGMPAFLIQVGVRGVIF